MDAEVTDWLTTTTGEPRGYIEPHALSELWFHTGTACNLACPFCLEGSSPGDTRLDRMTLADVTPLMQEAIELGVEQFSFTGGEPFIVKDFVNILNHASGLRPCLVLTNGTEPLLKRLKNIAPIKNNLHPEAILLYYVEDFTIRGAAREHSISHWKPSPGCSNSASEFR